MYHRNVMDVLPIKNVQILTRKVGHIMTHWQRNADFSKNSSFSIVVYLNPDQSTFRGDSPLVTLDRTIIKCKLSLIGCIFPLSMVCISR